MYQVLSTVVIASSLVAGLAAQAQQPGQQPSAPPAAQQPSAPPTSQTPAQPPARQQPATTQAGKITVSGCIQAPAPEASATGTTPPAGGATAASKYDLASAKIVGNSPVGTAGSTPAATRYRLEGDEKTISSHLNQQVEITGTVMPATATSATGTGAATNAAPMLKVDSVKMIAAKCAS